MARLTYNEIFTNVHKYDETGAYTGLQIASKLNQKNGQDYKLIDAVDIDWNGAFLRITGAYINNTEDLFESINNIADLSDLEWIREKINTLTENVDTILSTYVTKTELDEILAQYQKPISAGENITIDNDNVISTYGLITSELANELFAKELDFEELVKHLDEDYYTKTETAEVAGQITLATIQSNVIKNADEKYNDLEKISNWILSQPESITEDFEIFNNRLNRIDEALGYVMYNEEFDTYTYTDGLIYETHNLQIQTSELNTRMGNLENTVEDFGIKANQAYNTANTAYDMAYEAYTASNSSSEMAELAYEMAYTSVVKIGNRSEDERFEELTQEDIDLLNEDPNAIQVYAIRDDNHSGIPLPDYYNPDSGLVYYKFIEAVEGTGIYKELEDVVDIANEAKESADNALFRLHTDRRGTTYAYLSLSPDENDGSGHRTITLNVDEAEINKDNGEIEQDGLITTFSLSNTLSYISTFEIIEVNSD